MNKETILKHSEQVTFQTVAGEAILIRLDTGTYFSLNEVGTDFWELLNGRLTIADHAQTITDKYNAKTAAYVAALRKGEDAQMLANTYELDLDMVQQHLATVAKDAGQTTVIKADFTVPVEMVLADLIDLSNKLAKDQLVDVV